MILRIVPLALLAGLVGCMGPESNAALVPSNPFATAPPPPVALSNLAPASKEAAARVDQMGRFLIAQNPQIGVKPMFLTVGAPQAEVFHKGTTEIHITEGLVNQCVTDGQLAAVLCLELGKMVAEREALAGPQARNPERLPPMEVRVGNDNGGLVGPPDQTHLAELGKYEREGRRDFTKPLPAPKPDVLARSYLTKAGFPATDLDAISGVLQGASENQSFARQLTAPITPRNWTTP